MFDYCHSLLVFRKEVPIVGGPVFGIILGMIITLFIKDKNEYNQASLLHQKKSYSMRLSC